MAAGITIGLLTACSPTLNNHGNIPDAEVVKSIRIGQSNRDQIEAMLGTPSAVATFDKEAWYYVGSKTSQIAFWEADLLERKVLVIRFDEKGFVQQVERLDKQDGRDVQIVDRKTPTRGKELTVLEQLLGNIGKFSGPEADDGYEEQPGGPPTQGKQFDYEFAEGEQGVVFVQNIFDAWTDPVEYRWDTNPADGLQYCDGYANAVDFTPPDQGDYVVAVLATDSEGYELEAEVNIHAYNVDPEATIDLLAGFSEGTESQFYVDAYDQGPEDVVLLDLDIDGDGAYEVVGVEPGFVSYTPPQSGEVTLSVRAFDGDGGEQVVQQPLFVENLPPFLTEGPPDEIFVGEAWAYTLQVDDPSDLDTVTAELSEGPDGLTLDGLRLLWEPTGGDVGQNPYDITLTDSDGDQAVYFLRVGVFREGAGCGCSAASTPGPEAGAGLALLLMVGALRRRRR